jgi:uncharacterized paraquat-inducible protein A
MPYLRCPSCKLASYSAAHYSSRDQCPRCGATLRNDPRRLLHNTLTAAERARDTLRDLRSRTT